MEDEITADVREHARQALVRREYAEEEGRTPGPERIWAVPTIVLVRAASDADAVDAVRETSHMLRIEGGLQFLRRTDEHEDWAVVRMVVQSGVAVWLAAEDSGDQS